MFSKNEKRYLKFAREIGGYKIGRRRCCARFEAGNARLLNFSRTLKLYLDFSATQIALQAIRWEFDLDQNLKSKHEQNLISKTKVTNSFEIYIPRQSKSTVAQVDDFTKAG